MTSTPDEDLGRLLAEGPFLRALARQLVVGDADDVVQQTWLQALQHGGTGVERPRNWLARIARNVARNLHRGDERRRERERAAAIHELVPSSPELMQREERRRALVAAVNALPPALRTVVLLRWFDGWPPRRIARELGLPPATVATQLQRALKLLRRRLDAEHGGSRRAWVLPLLPLALDRGPKAALPLALTLPLVTGVVAMTTKAKVAMTAAVLFVAGFWLWWPDGSSIEPQLGERTQEHAAIRSAEPRLQDDGSTREVTQQNNVPPAPVATTGRLIVRARYASDDTPARDLLLVLRRPGTDPRVEGWRQRTGDDGMARFEDLPPRRLYLSTSADDVKRVEIEAGKTAEVDFAIALGLRLDGIVVDDAGGTVAGALIEVAPMARSDAYPEVFATTGADGRFSTRSCPRACLVGARAAGYIASTVRFFLAKDGNTAEVRLVVKRGGGTVAGRVVRAGGQPVAGAVVVVGEGELSGIGGRDRLPPFPALVRTDEDGRFRAVGIAPATHRVVARAVGLAPWQATVTASAWQTVPLHIELSPGATVRGVVRGAEGKPVARAEVEVGKWRDFAHYRSLTDAAGKFELNGLPGGEIEVTAKHDELGLAKRSVLTVPGTPTDCDLELSRGLELVGRVLRDNGQPVAKAMVECTAESGGWFAWVESDDQGRFAAANCPEKDTIRVTVRARGIEELTRTGVDPRGGELMLRVKSALPRSVRIVGTVIGPDGKPVGNATVGAAREGTQDRPGLQATDDEGRFELGPLVPGTWSIYVRSNAHPGFQSDPRALAANAVWDLGTIRLPLGGTVIVRRSDSEKAADCYVSDITFTRSWGLTNVEGRFRSSTLAPGRYLLVVRGKGIAAHCVAFEIRAGHETTVDVRPEPGVSQLFEIRLPTGSRPATGVSLLVKRGEEFVGRGFARARNGQPATTELWLPRGELTVTATTGELRGTATFTVGATPGTPVRVEMR